MDAPTKVRLNADLSPAVAAALKDLAKAQNVSLTEALSRAISTESVLAKRRQQGAKVVIDDGNGKLSEVIFAR
ncbi:hypothetical protein ACFOLJ_27390 [Rugamonas sp. CCM 8940]|uniref:hypothetical protein n=1 Tax=Rugamonas sp. CCM 8940 TaxID=2765359 RepID=UPI0018F709CB|nr:hypothetical protein [Rugamonas sp. CCM 8940]MBJ7311196.1 hypothetical protein [Rugamonas sp. CCM 8940]